MFNAFNISNLQGGYSFNLDVKNANPAAQTYAFGQPTQRSPQVFLSTGPRAAQVGARIFVLQDQNRGNVERSSVPGPQGLIEAGKTTVAKPVIYENWN